MLKLGRYPPPPQKKKSSRATITYGARDLWNDLHVISTVYYKISQQFLQGPLGQTAAWESRVLS